MKIQTNCKGCIFATMNANGLQNGCTMQRHSKLGHAVNEDGSFELKRFCNTYRPQIWLDNLTLDEKLNPEQVVMKEIYPRIGIFIKLDDTKDAISKLKITMDSLVFDPAYVVVITPKVEYNVEVLEMLTHKFQQSIKYHIVQLSTPDAINSYAVIDEAFSHAQNGWVYVTQCGEKIPSLLDKIHEWINVRMAPLVMVKPYSGSSGLLFQALLFKFLNGNRTKIFDDEYIDSRSFIDKVEAAQERSKNKCIFTSEEFLNEST